MFDDAIWTIKGIQNGTSTRYFQNTWTLSVSLSAADGPPVLVPDAVLSYFTLAQRFIKGGWEALARWGKERQQHSNSFPTASCVYCVQDINTGLFLDTMFVNSSQIVHFLHYVFVGYNIYSTFLSVQT